MDGRQVAQETGEQVPEPRAVSLSPVVQVERVARDRPWQRRLKAQNVQGVQERRLKLKVTDKLH